MEIFSNIEFDRLPASAVTIGMFDGVHVGHQELLKVLKENATRLNVPSVVVTFWPHPRIVLHQDEDSLRFLTSVEDKCLLFNDLGIDFVVVLPFTPELSQLSTEEFIAQILVDKLSVKHLVVGYNHRFGKGKNHDFSEYQLLADKYKFGIKKVEPVIVDSVKVSSTQIRNYLISSQLIEANRQLGYEYSLKGEVVTGNQLGRRINYPTANILLENNQKLIPADGVYACRCHLNGKWLLGMVNIGLRPTISNNPDYRTIEAHILDFNEDIYGERLDLHLVSKVREEIKFPSIDHLKEQLLKDEREVRTLFKLL